MPSNPFNTNFKRGILAVCGNLLVDFAVGEYNLLGFLYPYFVTYFRLYDPSITMKSMATIPQLWLFAQMFSAPIGIYIYMRLGFKLTYCLFITWFAGAQIICSFIPNFTVFKVIYGLSGGFCQGALMILPLYCCWRYFDPKHKATVSGIILSAYAIAPIFTSVLALKICNPGNLQQETVVDSMDQDIKVFPDEVGQNVPQFLRYFGVFCWVMGMTGVSLIQEPIDDLTYRRNSADHEEQEEAKESKFLDENQLVDKLPSQAVATKKVYIKTQSLSEGIQNFKDPNFLKVIMTMFFLNLFPHLMNFGFKTIGLLYLNDDSYVTSVGSMASVINAISRLGFGMQFFKTNFRIFILTIAFLTVFDCICFVPFSQFKATFFIVVAVFCMVYGGQLGSYPLVSDALFKEKGAVAYAFLLWGFNVSNIVVLFIYGALIDHIGWFWLLVLISVLACIPQIWVNDINHEVVKRKEEPVL